MSWIRSAMNKAAEVPGGAIFRAAVRSYTDSVVQHAGYSLTGVPNPFQDRIAPQNIQSFSDVAKRLEEVSVSCKREDRVQLLKSWLFALREVEKINGSPTESFGKSLEDPHTLSDKNVTTGKPAMILYYDPDLGSVPMNFRDVFLQSQALEGMTMSMILGAPNEEESLLLLEIFGICLTGGRDVHEVVVKSIKDLAKAFTDYDSEMLARREELLQFAQTAITGLKVMADVAKVDSEISQIQQSLDITICHKSAGESSENSFEEISSTSLMDTKESVAHIQLCCRLKSLLLKKRLLKKGDTPQAHFQKVDKLKVLLESLHNSAHKTEKRMLEHREQKKEILTFCVARTSEVSQIEKDLEAEISVIEKQRDKLEAELREVNSTLVDAITRLQDAREQRLQFDEDNNDFFLNLKEKEDELSKSIVSYRAEADACNAFINFLESTWDFQSSFENQRDKQVNDQLQNHEAYIVNVVASFLSAYKDQLEPAIVNLRKLLQSLKGYQYVIDPDEEFLHDTKQRVNIEQEYLDAEAKVVNIFNTVESIKEHFYSAIDDASRKDVEEINKLFTTIEKLERDFKINKRPILRIEIPTNEDLLLSPSTGSPQGVKISSPVRVMPDFKSIFSQNLIKSPRKKPYIPLGVSCENSPVSTMENDTKPTENKQQKVKVQEPEKLSHFDINVSSPTLEVENTTLSEQLQVSESQESKLHEHAKVDLDKELMTSALKKETDLHTESTQGGPGETPEASTDSNDEIPKLPLGAEHLSGNKKSVDPDEKLSKLNSETKEKDQVSTEDIASSEPDEVVKEQKDDSYRHKNSKTIPEHLSGNKNSVDPDEKPSKSNSEIKEKDQVSTEDIASRESDEVVKEQKDDSYHHKNSKTSPEHLSGDKKSINPDEKLSKSDFGIEEKDQVSSEDIAASEPDEIVKEQKDDCYHHENYEISPGGGFDSN